LRDPPERSPAACAPKQIMSKPEPASLRWLQIHKRKQIGKNSNYYLNPNGYLEDLGAKSLQDMMRNVTQEKSSNFHTATGSCSSKSQT
jgi:hypothetical protein